MLCCTRRQHSHNTLSQTHYPITMQTITSSRSFLSGAAAPCKVVGASRRATRVSRAGQLRVRSEQGNADSPMMGAINALTSFINKSPLAEGKKALAVAQAGAYDVEATQAKIQGLIGSNNVVVFSWTKCPFCIKAKSLLDSVGAKYVAVELDTMADGQAIRAELAKMTNRTSVPNVFIKGTSYGGMNDGPGIGTLNKEGRLVPMLQEAGAL